MAMLKGIREQYPSITRDWASFDGAYFHFYGSVALTHTRAPMLKARNCDGECSRDNRWVAMHFHSQASGRGRHLPSEYARGELHDPTGLPRDWET